MEETAPQPPQPPHRLLEVTRKMMGTEKLAIEQKSVETQQC